MKKLLFLILFLTGLTAVTFAQRTVRYSLTSNGTLTGEDLVANDDVTAGDDLVVTDDASIGGDISITGNLSSYKHVLASEASSSAGAGFDTVTCVMYQVNLINSIGDTVLADPPAPVAGAWFVVVNSRSTGLPIYVDTSADKLFGAANDVTLTTSAPYVKLVYVNSTVGWIKED